MGLPAGQQRILERIEGRLAHSDPRLESLFTIFTRLTLAEAMPWIEQLKARPVADRLAALMMWLRGVARRPAARVRAFVLIPAALTAVACGLALAVSFASSARPASGGKAHVARELVTKQHKLCGLGLVRVPVFAC